MTNWLGLVVIGALIYIIALAPIVPPAWKPVIQAVGGLLFFVGLILLVIVLLGAGV